METERRVRPVVFLSMQYKGREKHTPGILRAWMRYAIRNGYAPVAPWMHYIEALDDTSMEDRIAGLAMNMEVIKRCDHYWLCGQPPKSSEAWNEMKWAQQHGLVVRQFTASELPPSEVDSHENV